MHQYSSTSATKSGRYVITGALSGKRLSSNARKIDSSTNHGLAGRRISSGDAGPNEPTWGSTTLIAPACQCASARVSGIRSPASPDAATLFPGFGVARLLGPRGHRRRLRQHQQEFAVVDAGERLAEDAREHLP